MLFEKNFPLEFQFLDYCHGYPLCLFGHIIIRNIFAERDMMYGTTFWCNSGDKDRKR